MTEKNIIFVEFHITETVIHVIEFIGHLYHIFNINAAQNYSDFAYLKLFPFHCHFSD